MGRPLTASVAQKLVDQAGEKPLFKVNLSSNGIGAIEAGAFAALGARLLKLNLTGNVLRSPSLATFTAAALPSLQQLLLTGNHLVTLTTLEPLPALDVLRAEANDLNADNIGRELRHLASFAAHTVTAPQSQPQPVAMYSN